MFFDNRAVLQAHEGDPYVLDAIDVSKVGPPIDVHGFVWHYAVTSSLNATVRAQQAREYYANCSLDGYKDGKRVSRIEVTMQVPFNRRASHAKGFNSVYAGVETANPGPCWYRKDGSFRTSYGALWDPEDCVETGPVRGYPKNWTHWAKYTDEEYLWLMWLGNEMRLRSDLFPNFTRIVGHHEIDPQRKFDPGPTEYDVQANGDPLPTPAAHLRWLREQVFREQFADTERPPDT